MKNGCINEGLTSKEITTYKELIIKANYEQLKAMEDHLIVEMDKRNKLNSN